MSKKKVSKLICLKCGTEKAPTTGFYKSNSILFKYSDNRIPICKECLGEVYEEMLKKYENKLQAIYYFCMRFDIYFHLNTATKCAEESISYIQKINSMPQFKNRTGYDSDSLEVKSISISCDEVSDEVRRRWGLGYSNEEYSRLEDTYSEWINNYEHDTLAQKKLFQELSFLELERDKARVNNNDKKLKEMSELISRKMGDANIKPTQKKILGEEDGDVLGVMIREIENNEPIAQPLPEFIDVDKINKYILRYFVKPFARVFGLAEGEEEINLNDQMVSIVNNEVESYENKD